jgi:hypothetical protein
VVECIRAHRNGGRGMTKLSPKQEMILRAVATAQKALRDAKHDALKRAQQIAEHEVEEFSRARDHAVKIALDAGVPKAQIGRIGLGTTDHNTMKRIIARVTDVERLVKA